MNKLYKKVTLKYAFAIAAKNEHKKLCGKDPERGIPACTNSPLMRLPLLGWSKSSIISPTKHRVVRRSIPTHAVSCGPIKSSS